MIPSPRLVAAVGSLALLTGCVANQPTAGTSNAPDPISVTSTATTCEVAPATASAGTVRFRIINSGPQTTEFYLLASDGLKIVAEKEDIATGASAELSVQLAAGSYFTACKPGMRGDKVGTATFTVTG
jgi:iron uptake system component EfeO